MSFPRESMTRVIRSLLAPVAALMLGPTLGLGCTQNATPEKNQANAPATVSETPSEAAIISAGMTSADFLKANGRQMRKNSGSGAVVNLHGTNLGGWFLQEPWMSPAGGAIDEWNIRETLTNRFGEATKDATVSAYQDAWIGAQDLDNIQAMGMNFVRVPVWYLEFMDKYGNWRPNGFGRLDWLVSQCSQRGLYVLIDLHGTFGGQNTFDNCGEANNDPQLWHNGLYQDRTNTLWQGIAAHYKGNPAVAGYDLLNEPDRIDGWGSNAKGQLNDFYNRLYKTIRAVDGDHAIFMEAAWDWNMLEAPSTYGWTNVVYELHFYAMSGNQAQDWNAQNNFVDLVLQGINTHQYLNVPIYAGEFCFFDFTDLWAKALQGFNDRGVLWTNWTYKVTCGGNWGFYNNPTGVQWPNISTESAATIQSKWRTFTTAGHFQANNNLINVFKKYAPAQSSTYSIKAAANNSFICADNGGALPLVANRAAAAGAWEAFSLIYNSDGTVSLQSKANNLYVTADLNNGAKLIANRSAIGGWEKFKLINQSNGTVAIQAMANNLYVSADLNLGSVLVANRTGVQGWEQFTLSSF